MNAAGSLGFAPDPRNGIPIDSFGAFVTNPISLRPRLPASQPALIQFPGGFLLHTGLPNPGLNSALKKYSAKWTRSQIPIIVHLMADRPEETKQMVQMLENVENVMAVELGFAPLLANDIILLTLEMCLGELPLIFSLPTEQVLSLGPRLIQEGAQAISISTPRGALPITSGLSLGLDTAAGFDTQQTLLNHQESGKLITGRLYGQSLFPRSLEIVHSARMIGLPIIGAGGVWTDAGAESMLEAGAMAVEMDASLWVPREASASHPI